MYLSLLYGTKSQRPLNPCAQNRRFFAKIKGAQKAENVPVVAIIWAIREESVAGRRALVESETCSLF